VSGDPVAHSLEIPFDASRLWSGRESPVFGKSAGQDVIDAGFVGIGEGKVRCRSVRGNQKQGQHKHDFHFESTAPGVRSVLPPEPALRAE